MNQSQALKILQAGHNVFLTGSAGTGKTFLLNRYIAWAKKKKMNVGITASTGIAATHLHGRTIHSWAGMGISRTMNKKEIQKLTKNNELRARIRGAKVLIIDEISMLDADRLDLVDMICKAMKDPFLPFGGLQIIMCGDFFQLPPVDKTNQAKFAYESFVWQDMDIKICYLDEQFRQDDAKFTDLLNSIRGNATGEKELCLLQTRLQQSVPHTQQITKLYTHNMDVDEVNSRELALIQKDAKRYCMTAYGEKDLVKMLKKSCLSPEELQLKVGAVVMFVKNNFDGGYVNGTLGRVVDFDEDGFPIVKTLAGKNITATPASWSIEDGGEIIARVKQIPLRLAWAITVHKSQGMSLDAAEMDLSKSFAPGMGYVALSRVRTLRGIRLMGINKIALQVDERIVEKNAEFQTLSRDAVKDI